ncbi:MAG: class I adenylate-forming enzyme family protein [Gemmatimonadota bacterium]
MSLSVFSAAAEAPDRVALIDGDTVLTFAGLADRVSGVVAWLRARSLDGPDPVAVVATPDLATIEMLHALIAVGTPVLPLHPKLTDAERAALLDAVAPAAVLRVPRTAGREPRVADHEPRAADAVPGAARHESRTASREPRVADRPLAIIATSGTSGRPKGVVLSRRAFAASAAASAANLGWRDDDRWLLPLPLAHVGGLSILTRCLLARRAVVLAPDTDPAALMDALRRHRATLVSLVPTLLARILDVVPGPPPDPLRAVLLGGAAASPALLARAADRGWPVLATYGLTEACSQATTQRYATVNRGEAGAGPPLPGVELRIGDDGAILLRGPILFSGYLPPGADPFLDDGWFPTGDRGRLDEDGNLHVLGRRADRIVTGGENVDPIEVEQALERLPAVRRACVFGAPDAGWGEVVVAAVVPEPAPAVGAASAEHTASEADAETLDAVLDQVRGLRDVLAPFKRPRRVAVLDELPLNPNGKVDRAETTRRATGRLHEL